jgi:hypothetical protein
MANQSEIQKVEQCDGDCSTTNKSGDADRMGRVDRSDQWAGTLDEQRRGPRQLIEDGANEANREPGRSIAP